jgi:hypothetical protein
MRLPPLRDQRLDLRRGAGFNIGFAEVAAVSQQRFGLAQFIRQSRYLVEHRFKLLLVVGRLHHVDRNH